MPSQSRMSASDETTSTTTDAPASTSGSTPARSNQEAMDALRGRSAYEDAFGERVGGFLHEQVARNASPDKIDGYAKQGVKAGTGALSGWIMDHVQEGQKGDAKLATDALSTQLNTGLGDAIVGSDLGEMVSNFALDNPRTTLGMAGLGAAAYVLSDQKLEDLDTQIKLGGGNSLLLGGDFGTTLDPSLDAVRARYAYKDDHNSFKGVAESDLAKDAWSLSGEYQRELANGGSLTLDAAHRNEQDRQLTTGGLTYQDAALKAFLKGSHDTADGGVSALSAGFNTLGDGPRWTGGLDANTKGAWNANLGVSHKDAQRNLEWFAKGHAGQNEAGKADYGVSAGLNWRF